MVNFRKIILAGVCVIALGGHANAREIRVAVGSELTGALFTDRPIILPVVPEFQMALQITAASIGKRCTDMAVYGWRLGQNEQARADGIFSAAVKGIEQNGIAVSVGHSPAVSNTVTFLRATGAKRDVAMIWAATSLGLLLAECKLPEGL